MYRYSKKQLLDFVLPAICLLALAFLFHQTSLDEKLAAHFYSPAESWRYRNNFFLEKILHKGGVLFCIFLIACLFGRLLFIWKKVEKRKERDYLAFVLTATLLTIVTIDITKLFTTLPCPWSSAPFGGPGLSPPLWKMFSSSLPKWHCYPAGHASAGYAFLSMYFNYTLVYKKRNFYSLIPGMTLGLLFGFTQQMRGAHYISHDFTTIFVSIFISLLTYLFYTTYTKYYEK